MFLNSLCVGLCKEIQKTTAVVVSVRVGISELVGNTVEEQVPALSVHVHRQVLEDVHVAAVGYGRDAGGLSLGSDVLDSLCSNIPTHNTRE